MYERIEVDLTRILGLESEPEDFILNDSVRLAKASGLFHSQEGLRDILLVLMLRRAWYLVHVAKPEEVEPIRHGIESLQQVWELVQTYNEEYTRRQKNKGKNSPQVETASEVPAEEPDEETEADTEEELSSL